LPPGVGVTPSAAPTPPSSPRSQVEALTEWTAAEDPPPQAAGEVRRAEDGRSPSAANAALLARCRAFVAAAQPRVEALAAAHAGCVERLRGLACFFQEDFDAREPARQLQQLAAFLAAVERAAAELAAARARDAAAAEAASRQAGRWRRTGAPRRAESSESSAPAVELVP
jgi:hypothetical protein